MRRRLYGRRQQRDIITPAELANPTSSAQLGNGANTTSTEYRREEDADDGRATTVQVPEDAGDVAVAGKREAVAGGDADRQQTGPAGETMASM